LSLSVQPVSSISTDSGQFSNSSMLSLLMPVTTDASVVPHCRLFAALFRPATVFPPSCCVEKLLLPVSALSVQVPLSKTGHLANFVTGRVTLALFFKGSF
jgi:hypothetical protein